MISKKKKKKVKASSRKENRKKYSFFFFFVLNQSRNDVVTSKKEPSSRSLVTAGAGIDRELQAPPTTSSFFLYTLPVCVLFCLFYLLFAQTSRHTGTPQVPCFLNFFFFGGVLCDDDGCYLVPVIHLVDRADSTSECTTVTSN